MRRSHHLLISATALAGLLLALTPATATAQSEAGFIHGLIFDGATDAPLPGVSVQTPGARVKTNSDGAFRLRLTPGAHALTLRAPERDAVTVEVEVVAYEVTEAIITLYGGGRPPLVEAEVKGGRADAAAPLEASAPTLEPVARGWLAGEIRHLETGAPVAGARLVFRGTSATTASDKGGAFSVELDAGVLDVTVIHPDYATTTLPGVTIDAGSTRRLEITLTPSSVELESYSVVAPRIEGGSAEALDERRDALNVSEVLGAEQMSRSGDSDAAGALKRVTGVTVSGGRYVYVRGLGDRYAATLLDGARLPSPEPEKRVVPMDLFPAAVLESILIDKTWSPEMPGEFAGGLVKLRTRRFPQGPIAKLSLSASMRTGTTFAEGLRGPGGPTDALGFDGGTRALPDGVSSASDESPLLESDRFSSRGYSAAELEAYGESMPNAWTPERATLPPGFGLSGVVGNRVLLGGLEGGYLLGVTYDNDYTHEERRSNIYVLSGDGLELAHRYDFEETQRTINLSTIGATGLDLGGGHSLGATTLLLRVTDDAARIYQGPNRDVGGDIRVTRLRWLERMMLSQSVSGAHAFGKARDLRLDWRYTFALASREEPDRRETRFDLERQTGAWLLSDRPEGNQRLFSTLSDTSHDVGLDGDLPLALLGESARLKLGASALVRDRRVDTRRYKFQHKGASTGDTSLISQRPEEIFAPENIDTDGFQFEEITRQTDNYSAAQLILATYLKSELEVVEGLSLGFGARVERSSQDVETFELFNPAQTPVVASLTTTDVLPAATATWSMTQETRLRAAASWTVSRPDFRELSPATFNDVTGGRQVFGNPDLERARVLNADLRAEWYPSAGESVSVGVFAKRFTDPIEAIVVVGAQHSVSYDNAKGATNLGVELEARKGLDFIHPALIDLSVGGNLTLVRSRVELDASSGIQTSTERPLQGQAPYVFNLDLGYNNPDTGTTATALFHITGPRIDNVGALGAPDITLDANPVLDLVFKQSLSPEWTISAKASNLIDAEQVKRQGDEVAERWRVGRSFGVGVGVTF